MKRKFKQSWSTIPPISTKQTITSQLNSLSTKKNTARCNINPDPCLGQAQKYGRIKVINKCLSA